MSRPEGDGGPRRVVVIHSSDELYGADRMVLHVVASLRSMGLDVEVWLPSDVEHGRFPLCEVLERQQIRWRHVDLPILRRASIRPTALLRLAASCARTARALHREPCTLVYLSSSACLLAAPIARGAGVRHRVLHIQERWEGGSAHLLRQLARFTTARLAISRFVAGTARLSKPSPIIIENVVDDASHGRVRAVQQRDAGLHFVVASRWNRWKGHRTLFEAWESAGCPGTLTVLGGPPKTGEAVDVLALAAALSDPASVHIVGEVADPSSYIARADVLVLPSDDPEPFGLVVIEAFSMGRPVIASRAGGPLEVIDDGETGWFFTPRDAGHLARILRSLGVGEVQRAGSRSRQVYEERFRPSRFQEQFTAIIDAELSRR